MASSELKNPVGEAAQEPPRKRQKLSPTPTPTSNTNTVTTDDNKSKMDSKPTRLDTVGEISDGREAEVGILHFVNTSNPGFSGILKQRYVHCIFSSSSHSNTIYEHT